MTKENNESFSFNFDPYHSFLEPLVGEIVQVYRGGPESKTGKIVDVQSDYVALLVQDESSNETNDNINQKNKNDNNENKNNKNKKNDENNEEKEENQYVVVYYRTEHLQSIGENTKSNSMPRFPEEEDSEITYKTGTNFLNLVEQFTSEDVQINQGGPESKTGTLLEVSGNYMALLTEDDGVVFYNVYHIKSICLSSNNSSENDSEDEKQIPEYYKASTFYELFSKMNYKWVSINRGGPQALEGVLIVNGNGGGHYTLVNNNEVLRINPFHIKSISCGPKGALKSNQKNESNDDDSERSDESSSSSDKRSSRKKSSSKRSSHKKSSSKHSSSKRSSSKRSSHKRSSSKRSSSKHSSHKRSSGKRKSSQRNSHTRKDSDNKRQKKSDSTDKKQ